MKKHFKIKDYLLMDTVNNKYCVADAPLMALEDV